jgi:hypothetical protein
MKKTILGITAAALAFAAGCGSATTEQAKAKVKGTVTVDGKPLATGKVVFDARNGQPPADLDILDGKFEGYAPAGQCKVQLTAYKQMTMKEKMAKEGKKGLDGPGYDQPVQVNTLPDRYNAKSDISREVSADRPNDFSFDLKSK